MINIESMGSGKNLCLLHGWGAQNAVWSQWALQNLAPHFRVHLIELPGFGHSDALANQATDEQLAQIWTQTIAEYLPEKTHLLGWSLGGLLAQNIALSAPDKIERLICLASTPRFTQTDQWSGAVSPKLMQDFLKSIQADTLATLKRFWTLQLQGSDLPRKNLRQFVSQMQSYKVPNLQGLIQGLKLLNHFDFRDNTHSNPIETLWLLGENDPLIPTDFIAEFSTIQRNSSVKILHGAAHTPFSSHPDETAKAIIEFLQP